MKILITGGCGFIGSNLASYFSKTNDITVFDSLARKGSEKNLAYLKSAVYAKKIRFVKGLITDTVLIAKLVEETDVILHLAAQVAVTSSIAHPRDDFKINLLGTFNLLESVRRSKNKPLIIYSSTNKVYGEIAGSCYQERKARYEDTTHPDGIVEDQPLDFFTPYGCSKGGADSYVRDFGRIYNLPTVVFRKSCIYGARQFGTEDQGWVAHFARKALLGETITIYGNSKQVRDLLYIDDLIRLYELVIENHFKNKHKFRGEVFNVGGGAKNAYSLLEIILLLENILKRKVPTRFNMERTGDQKVYISNIEKARKYFNWSPKITIEHGLNKLVWFILSSK